MSGKEIVVFEFLVFPPFSPLDNMSKKKQPPSSKAGSGGKGGSGNALALDAEIKPLHELTVSTKEASARPGSLVVGNAAPAPARTRSGAR